MTDLSRKPRIFVTGATGLLGAHIVKLLLERGYKQITALRRASSRMELTTGFADRIQWVVGDLSDKEVLMESMRNTDWVIHCAALIAQGRKMVDRMYEVNAEGTANMVDCALATGVSKMLHVSSISVFTRTGGKQHITEETEWERTPFTSEYGYTKHRAEMELWRGHAEGLDIAIINPSIILGPGYWHDGSTMIFKKIWNGLKVYPAGVNGYVDVRDVAHLAMLRLEQDLGPERMIVNAENLPFLDLFTQVARHLDRRPPAIRVSPLASELAWRVLHPIAWITGTRPSITRETARTTRCQLFFDNRRSLQVPGFVYTPIQRTIADIAAVVKDSAGKKYRPLTLGFLPHHLA